MRMKKTASKSKPKPATGFKLGRAGFEKISAVEGIRFSADLKRTFRDLDRNGASAGVRRRTMASKYGKAPA
jgi:hypothetical protein